MNYRFTMVFGILMRVVSWLTSFPAFITYAILLYFATKDLNMFILFIVALFICSIGIKILRLFFRRKRENTKSIEQQLLRKGAEGKRLLSRLTRTYLMLEERSFASAHVGRIGAIGFIYYTTYVSTTTVLIVFVCAATLVAVSRLYLKRHTRLDVVVGLLVGVLSGYLAKVILGYPGPFGIIVT